MVQWKKIFLLFLSVLDLHCCTQAFSRCGRQGLHFVSVHGPLTAVASLEAWVSRSWDLGVQVSVVVAQALICSVACGIFSDEGFELMSPALAGDFLSPVSPGKSWR